MPLINSKYQAPIFFKNRHLQTIYPTLFRGIKDINYLRERVETPDNDFIDLDWAKFSNHSNKLLIMCHGLEGSSQSIYMKGTVQAFEDSDLDIVAINLRGCSGESNKLIKTYHSGKSEDLDTVIKHVLELDKYQEIYLLGYSIGGNIVLKYLGETNTKTRPEIKKAMAISVPIDLRSASEELSKFHNKIYMQRFLGDLYQKIKIKEKKFPEQVNSKDYHKLKNFRDFDGRYTAPHNGFNSAEDYWERASSIELLDHINIPTLLLSSTDDPFFGPECFPFETAQNHKYLYFEAPENGGHVGFVDFNKDNLYFHERRIIDFISES